MLKTIFAALRNRPAEPARDLPIRDQDGNIIDDPVLTRITNEALQSGKPVVWNEGDDLPERHSN